MAVDYLRSGTQTIQRCATLLRLITAHHRTGLRLLDLYTMAQLSRPTVHRMLQALVAEGLVRQDEKSRRYFLGSLVYEMGVAAAPTLNLREICLPFLNQLAQDTGDTAFLTIRSGLDGVCIARSEGAAPIKAFVLDVGRRRPLNIGGGALAILSALDNEEIERIWLANQARIHKQYANFNLDHMWQTIRQARKDGYLLSQVIEVEGLRTLAAPLMSPTHQTVGGVSVAAQSQRLSGQALTEKVAYLCRATTAIESRLHELATTSVL